MQYDLILQREAVGDLQIAYDWYEEQKSGLGDIFLHEVERSLNKLKNHPSHYSIIKNWIRKIKINKFPFLIIFEISADAVFVTAIRHTSRKPKY